ncbi:hypothetical protein MJO28_015128 [Puccinia striiformis f. sp. tritici]|uniref:Uncharacterized protein n=1 Tax=Puccinia striiformis f. sp. tritici TaxID=168172 RepID=A0ACC0DRR8_9BASI|nr:hypothetical protein MJO28_015128 [Puccinia striiformis f. sp. tritici]
MYPAKTWIVLLSSAIWNIIPKTFTMPPPGRRPYPEMLNFYPQDLGPQPSSGLKRLQLAPETSTRTRNQGNAEEQVGLHYYPSQAPHRQSTRHTGGIDSFLSPPGEHNQFEIIPAPSIPEQRRTELYDLPSDHLSGEDTAHDYFRYGKLLLDGHEDEFVQDLILRKHNDQSNVPLQLQSTSQSGPDRGWVPTHTDRFTQETDTQDTGANSNHMLSGNFGSISSIMMDHSIASMSATLGSENTPINPAFQAETKRPTSNEHFEISPAPSFAEIPKERTPQQLKNSRKRKTVGINSSMPPLRPEKIMKQISQDVPGLPGITSYADPTRADTAFGIRLEEVLPKEGEEKKSFGEKYQDLPLALMYYYSTKDGWLIGFNIILDREGNVQSGETLNRCFSQLSSSSFEIFNQLSVSYPHLVPPSIHDLMAWILDATFGSLERRPLIGRFINPESVDLKAPLKTKVQRILLHFFSTASPTHSTEAAIVIIGEYLMEKRRIYWKVFFSDFDTYTQSINRLTQQNPNGEMVQFFRDL